MFEYTEIKSIFNEIMIKRKYKESAFIILLLCLIMVHKVFHFMVLVTYVCVFIVTKSFYEDVFLDLEGKK